MEGPVTVLLVEDNTDIQEATALIFEWKWPEAKIIQAFKGGDGINLAKSEKPDLVLLDLGLPDMDGMRVLKEIRGQGQVPVIILTVRGEEMDKVRALELGADDYIVKPFDHRELLARIRTVMQRCSNSYDTPMDGTAPAAGQMVIDFPSGTVFKGQVPLKLTATESTLLKYLASHVNSTLSDHDILAAIWGEDYTDCGEYLEAYIRRLREKVEDDPRQPSIITGENGGYRFTQDAN